MFKCCCAWIDDVDEEDKVLPKVFGPMRETGVVIALLLLLYKLSLEQLAVCDETFDMEICFVKMTLLMLLQLSFSMLLPLLLTEDIASNDAVDVCRE